MFRQLDPRKIYETTQTLSRRVIERFPDAGLAAVSRDVAAVAKESAVMSIRISRPIWPLRIAAILLATSLIFVVALALGNLRVSTNFANVSDLAQGIESSVNDIIFVGVAIWFVFTIETRIKRRRALNLIGQLRALAHVIDMHQLTKDPERVQRTIDPTDSSPKLRFTAAQLTRYLDYCSEMLSVLGKLAALCAQRFNDPVTLNAVKELEDLTGGLSRKIWQKIMIIDRIVEPLPTESGKS